MIDLDALKPPFEVEYEPNGRMARIWRVTLEALIAELRDAREALAKTEAIRTDFKRQLRLGTEQVRTERDEVQAELAAYRAVVEAARELVSPCEHERGFCHAHGTVRLPCPIAELAAALAELEALR